MTKNHPSNYTDIADAPATKHPGKVLEVTELCSGYSDIDVLRSINISLLSGEMLGLLGRNGAGKTTFLSTISGTISVRSGKVVLFGRDVSRVNAASRMRLGIGHVPQGRKILHGMSVRDNLLVGGFVIRGRNNVNSRVAEVLELLPILGNLIDRDGQSLSGGQQQVLALARALMCSPKILLLDEPLTGLSPIAAGDVMEALMGLKEIGLAVLIVEQNAQMVLDWCDRVTILDNGHIQNVTERGPESLRLIERSYLGFTEP